MENLEELLVKAKLLKNKIDEVIDLGIAFPDVLKAYSEEAAKAELTMEILYSEKNKEEAEKIYSYLESLYNDLLNINKASSVA